MGMTQWENMQMKKKDQQTKEKHEPRGKIENMDQMERGM